MSTKYAVTQFGQFVNSDNYVVDGYVACDGASGAIVSPAGDIGFGTVARTNTGEYTLTLNRAACGPLLHFSATLASHTNVDLVAHIDAGASDINAATPVIVFRWLTGSTPTNVTQHDGFTILLMFKDNSLGLGQ